MKFKDLISIQVRLNHHSFQVMMVKTIIRGLRLFQINSDSFLLIRSIPDWITLHLLISYCKEEQKISVKIDLSGSLKPIALRMPVGALW